MPRSGGRLQWWETCLLSAVGVMLVMRLLASGGSSVTTGTAIAVVALAVIERSAGLLMREDPTGRVGL